MKFGEEGEEVEDEGVGDKVGVEEEDLGVVGVVYQAYSLGLERTS